MYKKLIVVKIGSSVLANKDHRISGPIMEELVRQVADLYERDIMTVMVSSGAGLAGKEVLPELSVKEKGVRQQVFCAVGQPRLMRLYYNIFQRYGMRCAQILATKDDFVPGIYQENLLNCFNGLFAEGIIPIVNEDDVTSLQMSMFTDNDELASLVADLLHADQLILLTDIDGFFNGNPKKPGVEQLRIVKSNQAVEQYIQASTKRESEGRGGMKSKLSVAKAAAAKGLETIMANGKIKNIILDIVNGEERGTKFVL